MFLQGIAGGCLVCYTQKNAKMEKDLVTIAVEGGVLEGNWTVPPGAAATVVFAHGSGSSRHSPRNQFVAGVLRQKGLGTLLIDLLTSEEEEEDRATAALRFDIALLTERLVRVVDWVSVRHEAVGCFGASTGAAAALAAAALRPQVVKAVVSRGGRPDLAISMLQQVHAPTLLIVGGEDGIVIDFNEEALRLIPAKKQLVIIPGATHLFEEPGALEEVARLAGEWFTSYVR
jgi:dienelactone hydrolase